LIRGKLLPTPLLVGQGTVKRLLGRYALTVISALQITSNLRLLPVCTPFERWHFGTSGSFNSALFFLSDGIDCGALFLAALRVGQRTVKRLLRW
jgi:hypothetical protein